MVTKFMLFLNTNQVNSKDPSENERSSVTKTLQPETRLTALSMMREPAEKPVPFSTVFWV